MADSSLESLNSFLRSHYENFATKRRVILERSKIVLESLLTELREREPLFDFEPVSPSTFFEVKSSNTLEVLLNLKNFDTSEETLSIEDGQTPIGFAFAKINGKKTIWDDWCVTSNSGKKYLSSRIINEKLLEHISEIIQLGRLRFDDFSAQLEHSLGGHALTLKFSGNAHEDEYLCIVPTIPCRKRWTFSAHAWQHEESYWPSKTMKQEAISDGIHLVGRPSRTKSPYHWQIAFLQPMKRFLADKTGCRHKCLMILRIILENNQELQKGVSGFHLETIMLHLLKKFPAAAFWRDDKFAQRFMDVVRELLFCVESKYLSDFFLPELNLLKDLCKSSSDAWKRELNALQQNPIEYLNNFESAQQNTAF